MKNVQIKYKSGFVFNDGLSLSNIRKNLQADCQKCFGLCCVALYFSSSEGFPTDKAAGYPCPNLSKNYSCNVHENLIERGFKGCVAYDCFGAGQKVAQSIFHGNDWYKFPQNKNDMSYAVRVNKCK
ncbi:hypothetical protein [Serpentinicella alkaliphila]|uniref:Uncharacterized protein n=1 Tax=Serpentinicella alkaliphila TaxID=1734049 RepID=A0A4R2T2S8_9FIRM|nr:hypothetical protein HZR23_10975 [Serpentinicella alkaliphila]TCP95721.1 hypothetical protein EDD79_105717 [Serpentinicella alkaliphila]